MAHLEDTSPATARQKRSSYVPCVELYPEQEILKEHRIVPLINKMQSQKRFFYGIEIFARTEEYPVCLDFSRFVPLLPLFVSIAWLGRSSWNVEPIDQVESLQLAKHLAPHIPVMPHLTAYRLTDKRLDEFLNLNFSNVLATRGDVVHPGQTYSYSKPIVERAKKRSGDKVSVCVAGFPEGNNATLGVTDHLKYLKEKVEAGADCIITQECYRPETIINYVKKVRDAGIKVPILIGLTAHESFQKFKTIERLQGVRLPTQLNDKLLKIHKDFKKKSKTANPYHIRNFFIQVNANIICNILKSNVHVYGFHIFTLNNFGAIAALLRELGSQELFNGNLTNSKQCQ